jgi:MYXO-CTERM domain-containing protein
LTENDAFGTGTEWLALGDITGAGSESNFPLALAYFRFSEGWIAGHVGITGTPLAGNLSSVTVSNNAAAASYSLSIAGVDPQTDGLLFVLDANNQASANYAASMISGTGWEVRVYDQGATYPNSGNADFSFVYVPFGAENLIGARVDDDGTLIRSAGGLTVTALSPAGTYLIQLPDGQGGFYDDTDGILLLSVSKAATLDNITFGPDDNFLVYQYSPADQGFIVLSHDLPNASDQTTEFNVAFLRYDQPLAVPEPAGWALGLGGLAALAAVRRRGRSRAAGGV